VLLPAGLIVAIVIGWRLGANAVLSFWLASKALRRRSQRTRLTWPRMNRIANRWLPPARVKHPFPDARFDARTQGRSPVR
jgi:hypothetical protein